MDRLRPSVPSGAPTRSSPIDCSPRGNSAAAGSSIPDLSHPERKENTMLGYANGPFGVALHWRYVSSMGDLMDGPNSGDPDVARGFRRQAPGIAKCV